MRNILFLLLLTFFSCGKKVNTEHTDTPVAEVQAVEEPTIEEESPHGDSSKWGRTINNDGDIELFTSLWWTEEIDPYWGENFGTGIHVKRTKIDQSEIDTSRFHQQLRFLEQDTLAHLKVDGRISLPLHAGKNIILVDTKHDNDAMAIYGYKGYIATTDQYLVDVMMWERYAWLAINKSDGVYTMIGNSLHINDDQTLMFSYEFDPYGDCEDIYIYEIEPNKGFKLIYKDNIPEESIKHACWQGNSIYTVSERPFSDDMPLVYHRIDVESDK